MRTHSPGIMVLLLLLATSTALEAQNSPAPTITDYDNTSLPAPLQVGDTTFCHAQAITIHGQDFRKATGGENWDTTWVVFGTVAPTSVAFNLSGSGNNDRITCQIPASASIAGVDTCILLRMIKKTHQGANTYYYYAQDSICLTGDKASVNYGASLFCLGDTNPLPSISLSPSNASGGFCCATGASGFWVNPATGEIPLHLGAVGMNNQFLYGTNHPRCADTVAFTTAIQPMMPSIATIGGQTQVTVCKQGGWVMADTASLHPQGGVFRSPTGLYMLNPFDGLFDPALSPAGLHELWYVPVGMCYDSTLIQVIILPTNTATVGYPTIPLNAGLPTLCKSAQTTYPVFASGNAGGSFLTSPVGLSINASGAIDPANSLAGTYTIRYASTGACPDTVTAIANLKIDTTIAAQFTLPQAQYCANDVLVPFAQNNNGTWQILSANVQVLFSQGSIPISIAASGIAQNASYELRHVTGGFCSDTATVPFTILPTDNPAFTYPPNGNFCIGDPDPYPLVSGNGGGYYTAVTPATLVDLDGRLHLQASGAGAHTIRHISGGTCKDSADVTVQIFGSASANFAYPASLFCSADTNPIPQILGTPGGQFTCDPGLTIDSSSGMILLQQSQAGTFNVTYSLMGSCQAQFTQTVQVSATDSATAIVYTPDHYCQSSSDPIPLIGGDTVGTFVAGGGIVFSNTDLGQLDLSTMQAGGPYIVYYDIANRCAIDTRDSIWIDTPDDPSFAYTQSSYCEGGANPMPSSITQTGGAFSEPTASVVFANASTGEIDASLSLQGGPYFITHTTAGACPESATFQLILLPKPYGAILSVDPDTAYCELQEVTASISAGGLTGIHWFLNGAAIGSPDIPTLTLQAELLGQDTLITILENAQGCTDTLQASLTGLQAPHLSARVASASTDAFGSATIVYELKTDQPNTVVDWAAQGEDIQDLNPDHGTFPAFNPGQTSTLTLALTLPTTLGLGTLQTRFSPRGGGCEGQTMILIDTLLPDAQPVFVPEAFTPDGNGQNDTWMITCTEGADPADYKISLFNEAGGKVLDMDGLHQHYEGQNLPDGVYWWVLEERGGKTVQAGGLTIRRK